MRFLKKISACSVNEAKNRLKSVINNDRINVTYSSTLSKIKKEVTAVLMKYSYDKASLPKVTVHCDGGKTIKLAATMVPMDD